MIRKSFSSVRHIAASFAAVIILTAGNAVASEPDPVSAWYDALENADAVAFEKLLTRSATIELRDLDLVQSKDEFVRSMDEWAKANRNAVILTRIVSQSESAATVEVCYRFETNEVLMQERFELADMQISKSVQTQLSEACGDF